MRYTLEEQTEALDYLKSTVKPSDTLYTVLKHVSQSGMTRHISVMRVTENKTIQCLDWYILRALDRREAKDGSVVVGGCGMDMGFHLIYTLSSVLFHDGFTCVGEGELGKYNSCPANDHFNGDRDYTPHNHRDGGYALKQQWV